MAVDGRRVTVTTTATKLNSATTDSVSGSSILVRSPTGAAAIDIGGSGVVAGAGFPLAGGESWTADLSPGDDVYGRVGSGTVVVHVSEVGL